jgi:exodeoxyribonuclease-3
VRVCAPNAKSDLDMTVTLATWNINSVRLRFPLVEKFCAEYKPDILCLQETKCRDAEFPSSDFRRIGYEYLAINGQKGYHGVCIASRLPILNIDNREFCAKGDSRHVAITVLDEALSSEPVTIHNFYVPAGGDEPDPAINPKFEHKLAFLDEMIDWMTNDRIGASNSIIVGDLNIAPLETDVWNHKALLKIVSHTPVEVERMGRVMTAGPWSDIVREHILPDTKVYSWWSYRSPDWSTADKGRRLDHIWTSANLSSRVTDIKIVRDARGWERPSDHVPIVATFSSRPR